MSIGHYKKTSPGFPPYTCPTIDSIIGQLEEVRKANEQLRKLAEYWEEKAEILSQELDEMTNQYRQLQSDYDNQS